MCKLLFALFDFAKVENKFYKQNVFSILFPIQRFS